ncbi:hypothetical protein ACFLZ5_06135 [Thermodesulfobacteriota bacterium]
MKGKMKFRLSVSVWLLSIAMVFGSVSFVAAGGGNVEDPVGDIGAHLQGPAIIGTLTLTYTEECLIPNVCQGTVHYSIIGSCKNNDVDISNTMTAEYAGVDNAADFADSTEEEIQSIIAPVIPAECYPDLDNTTSAGILAVNVKKPVSGEDINENPFITAGVVALSVVYK